jgi:hypothetical protein
MEKPKTLEQLRAEKEQAETRLAQEQHKLNRLENRKKFLEQGERKKHTHRLCNVRVTCTISHNFCALFGICSFIDDILVFDQIRT